MFVFSSKESFRNVKICSLNLNKINAEDFSKFITGMKTVKLDFNFLTFEQSNTLFEKVRILDCSTSTASFVFQISKDNAVLRNLTISYNCLVSVPTSTLSKAVEKLSSLG